MHNAAVESDPKTIGLLLKFKADKTKTNQDGSTPYELANAMGQEENAQLLKLT